jgi:hypothetical protein
MMLATMETGAQRLSHSSNTRRILLLFFGLLTLGVGFAIAAGGKPGGKGPCPEDWHLKGEEKSYKGGKVFMCIPDKPSTKVTCHPDTEYFEEDGAFGCEVPAEIEDDVEEEEADE